MSSRYYETYSLLCQQIKVTKYIQENIGTASFASDGYKITFNAETTSTTIFTSIKKYLDDNLYTVEEKILFIENLIPFVKHFDSAITNRMVERKKNCTPEDPSILEYDKAIESFTKAKELLTAHFTDYFDSLISLKEKSTEQINTKISNRNTNDDIHTLDVNDFFEQIEEGEITKIEIHNTVEKITSDFKPEKLKILLADFEFYLHNSKEEKDAEYSSDDIFKEMEKWKKQGKEIPYKKYFFPVKNEEGKLVRSSEETKILDKEKLLYEYDFFTCYQFKNFLITEINKRVKSPEPPAKIATSAKFHSFKYKKFNNSQDLLKKLFSSLKSKGFIAKDTDLKDFKKIFSGEAIEKPVVWTGNKSELCYFIKQLATEQNKVEDLKFKHWEVATICFVYPNNKGIDRDQLKGQKAPATAKTIETIVGSL